MGRHTGPGGPHRSRARRGALRESVLGLLAERPMHGYELITELEERTGGRWRPSPGSIYPLLAALEDEGLVRSSDDDGRKRFELTDAGRARVEEHAGESRSPWDRAAIGHRGDLRRLGAELFGQLRHIGRFGSPEQIEQARTVLERARRDLYVVLAEPPSPPADSADDQA